MKFETEIQKIESGLDNDVNEQSLLSLFGQYDTQHHDHVVVEAAGGGYEPNSNYLSWQNTETNGLAHLFQTTKSVWSRFDNDSEAEAALRQQLPPPKFERYKSDYQIVFANGDLLKHKLQAIAKTGEGSGTEPTVPMNPKLRYQTFISQNSRGDNKVFATIGDNDVSFVPTIYKQDGTRAELNPFSSFAVMLCNMIDEQKSGRSWSPQQLIDLDSETYIRYLSEPNNFDTFKEGFYQSFMAYAEANGTPATSSTPATLNAEASAAAAAVSGAANGSELADIIADYPVSYVASDKSPAFKMGGKRQPKPSTLNMTTLSYPQSFEYAITTFFDMVHRLKSGDNNFKIEDMIGYVPSNIANNTKYLTNLYNQKNVLGMEYSGWNRQLQKFHKFMDGIKTADFNVMQA